jgi:predicted nucleic acid-binding protein
MDDAQVIIVADTTATFPDVMMTHTRWMQLLSLCAKNQIRLAIPEVVLRETARHWEKQAKDVLKAAQGRLDAHARVQERLVDLGLDVEIEPAPPLPEIDIDQQQFLGSTQARLQMLGVEIPPVPDITVEEILERDLARRKPFAANGKGFRDVLVWESLKELAHELKSPSVVYLITDNTEDYCSGNELHADLKAEIATVGVEIRVVKKLEDLQGIQEIASMISGLVADDGELAKFLLEATTVEQPDYTGPTVGDIVRSALESAAEDLVYEDIETDNATSSGLDFTQFDIPAEINSPEIAWVETDKDSADWETYETYDDTTALVHGSISASLSIQGLVIKADLGTLGDLVELVDEEWSDDLAQVTTTTEARLSFQLRVEIGVGVEDVEFEGAEPLTMAPTGDTPLFSVEA